MSGSAIAPLWATVSPQTLFIVIASSILRRNAISDFLDV